MDRRTPAYWLFVLLLLALAATGALLTPGPSRAAYQVLAPVLTDTDTPTITSADTPTPLATLTHEPTCTLSPTPSITPTPTGTLPTATPTRPFSVTRTPTSCPTPSISPTTGPCVQPIREDFESGTLGIFRSEGTPGWAVTTNGPHSGTYAAFAPDLGSATDVRLALSTAIAVPLNATQATLSFYHKYGFEGSSSTAYYDGGVLEASTDGGYSWITPSITSNGYNGVLYSCPSQNPLAGQWAWTGSQPNWTQVTVDLYQYRGRSLLFRFRLGTDQTGASEGWWIDDIAVVFTQSVCFSPTPTGSPSTATPCPMSFTDVHPSDYFYNGARYLYCEGAISGYGDGTFRPSNFAARAQVVKIVVLAYSISCYCVPVPTFNDVPVSHPFFPYINTAYWYGIISGYNCSSPGEPCPGLYFRPYNPMTRAQTAKVVVLAAGWTILCPGGGTFIDVPRTNPFYCYIETAYCHQVVSGYSCGLGCLEFRPNNSVTRGQVCKIVYEAILNHSGCP